MIAYILNLFDLVVTLCMLSIGMEELNPFMRNVPFMVVYKVVVVYVLIRWLQGIDNTCAEVGLKICTLSYALLAVYHIVGIWVVML